jgi:hypothetical protein
MKEIRPIAKSEIEEALANSAGDLANQVLYDLCSGHPFHKTDQDIIAKVWLIGRSYAAAIERRKNKSSDAPGDMFYETIIAPKIRNSEIDGWLSLLKSEPIPKNAIEIHYKLMALFCEISGHQNRSLASKYLHFHQPDLFFILDSRSVAAIRRVTPRTHKEPSNLSTKETDKDYANFYSRCLWLQENLQTQFGRKLSPREIDKILLHIEGTITQNGEPKANLSAVSSNAQAQAGNLPGKIWMSPDFDAPLDDFKDYMK